MTREEHKALIDNIKAQAGDVPGAVISDDLAILMSDNSGTLTTVEELNKKVESLSKDNQSLIQANGKLFLKIGSDSPIKESPIDKDSDEPVLSIAEIINSKGEMI